MEIVEQIVAPGLFHQAMAKLLALRDFAEGKNLSDGGVEAIVVSKEEF